MNTAYSAASGMSHRPSTSRFENSPSNAATATDVTMPDTTSSRENIHVVKNNPKAVGTVACIIMAPEILARASLSLPWRTQMSAFMVSGSSVAMGLNSSATNCGDIPAKIPIDSNWPTNTLDAIAMTISATVVCISGHMSPGSPLGCSLSGSSVSSLKTCAPRSSCLRYTAYATRNTTPSQGL